jgi:hypothetical protein
VGQAAEPPGVRHRAAARPARPERMALVRQEPAQRSAHLGPPMSEVLTIPAMTQAPLRGLTHLVPIQPGPLILRVRHPTPEAHPLDLKRSGLQAIPQAERPEGASTAP